MKPTIHILGFGALGRLFASKLKLRGDQDVRIITRRTLPSSSISCTYIDAQGYHHDQTFPHISIHHINEDISRLLVFTKSYQVINALDTFFTNSSSSSSLLLGVICNGLGVEEELLASPVFHRYTRDREVSLMLGSTTMGALKEGEGVRETGQGTIFLGPSSFNTTLYLQNTKPSTELLMSELTIKHAFERIIDYPSSFQWIQTHPELHKELLTKVAVNAIINSITALCRFPNGFIFKKSTTTLSTQIKDIYGMGENLAEFVEKYMIHELWQVVEGDVTPKTEAELLAKINEVATMTSKNRSSMLCDVESGIRTENKFILGYVLQKAKQKQVKTPILSTLFHLIEGIDEYSSL